MAESKSPYGLRTYISLFSSAGVGCFGFKEENFHCVATVEILERRLKIQKYNHKCACESGYICGDMTEQTTKDKVFAELDLWKRSFNVNDLDVLIATPPCQGMSVANHKKKDELKRNSLVVESIAMTEAMRPKFFVFENVRAFLSSVCTDTDNTNKAINEAIEGHLSGMYNISCDVVNFKDYGNPSSRTRTLVIGVRKDIKEITPYDLFPDRQPERTLWETIGDLPPLRTMGEISPTDIYHNFRRYSPHMEAWISLVKEGQSAFDNTDTSRIPHMVKDGVVVYNTKKNGDKYTRQRWNKVAPCVHTRNDILASQNTVHPTDNRVFSIREVMRMMSVPASFNWSDKTFEELNAMPKQEKEKFLKREEMNIRQNLGEAVPTIIFRQIAHKIRMCLCRPSLSEQDVKTLVVKRGLTETEKLLAFIRDTHSHTFAELAKIAELANAQRDDHAAYYTRQDICYAIVRRLPTPKKNSIRILEPSVGVGNFIPMLIQKYSYIPEVSIDVVDIDANSITILQELVSKISIPSNIHINYIHDDFLLHVFEHRYDVVVGNPPFMKIINDRSLLTRYKAEAHNQNTNNLFAYFMEKAMRIGDFVSLIVPKSLINAPEFNETRNLLSTHSVKRVIDFGEKGFKGVKIETICIQVSTTEKPTSMTIESYITSSVRKCEQSYITSSDFPYWLIYRDCEFDAVASTLTFNVFRAFRDRVITKAITKPSGKVRVLKSRNIGDNEIVDIPGYDSYIDDIAGLDVAKYLNREGCVLLPNLTYNPRACFLPKGCIADGSVAILTPIANERVTEKDLAFYATKRFARFYAIARNMGTRSLNIDNNSVFFFGILKH